MKDKKRKALIVEDNKCVAEELHSILKEIDSTLEVYCCKDYQDACDLVLEESIDVFLVDIILDTSQDNDVSGLNFVRHIRAMRQYKFSPVVFITSVYDSKIYAYDQLHCYHYLEKPFDQVEAKNIIKEALEMSDRYEVEEYIRIKDSDVIIEQKINDIVYIKSKDRKLEIVSTEGTMTLYYKTVKEVKKQVLAYNFFQCNRNILVNRKYIRKIDMGRGEIILKDNYGTLEFGRVYKKRINEEFSENSKL